MHLCLLVCLVERHTPSTCVCLRAVVAYQGSSLLRCLLVSSMSSREAHPIYLRLRAAALATPNFSEDFASDLYMLYIHTYIRITYIHKYIPARPRRRPRFQGISDLGRQQLRNTVPGSSSLIPSTPLRFSRNSRPSSSVCCCRARGLQHCANSTRVS
jgi:hypothetical protein